MANPSRKRKSVRISSRRAHRLNPAGRRRRRSNPIMRVRHRRTRRNPLNSGLLMTAGGAAAGAVAAKALAGLVPVSSSVLQYILRGAIGYFGGPVIGKLTKSSALGDGFVVGAFAGIAIDIYDGFTGSGASLGEYIAGQFATPDYPAGLRPAPGGASFNSNRPSPLRTALGPGGGM